jgi:hypothetical protein
MESKPLNGRVMNEYVLSGLTGNETKSLGIVEPFNGSSLSFSHFSYSLRYMCELGEAVGQNKKSCPVSARPGSSSHNAAKTYFIVRKIFYHVCAKSQIPVFFFRCAITASLPAFVSGPLFPAQPCDPAVVWPLICRVPRHPKMDQSPRAQLDDNEHEYRAEEDVVRLQEVAGPNLAGVVTLTMSHFEIVIIAVLWQNQQYGHKHIHRRTDSAMGIAA